VPLGAWARHNDAGELVMDACIAALDGSEHYRERRTSDPEDGPEMGQALAETLLQAGGKSVLDRILGDQSRTGAPFQP
jgi:hydroxymethylbilane synthase